MSEWQALVAGFAFYLIIEGLMPFFNPDGFKRTIVMVLGLSNEHLRRFGGLMMIVGVILLFSIK